MSAQEIKSNFCVTLADGETLNVTAGAVEPDRSGSLVFYNVYVSMMSSGRSPFKWLAPGTWKEVTRVKRG
jgi:hypothetical protein